jgi:hypothetical protein
MVCTIPIFRKINKLKTISTGFISNQSSFLSVIFYILFQLVNKLNTLLLESNTITSTQDVYVFLSVINGALVLHAGNAGILRLCRWLPGLGRRSMDSN